MLQVKLSVLYKYSLSGPLRIYINIPSVALFVFTAFSTRRGTTVKRSSKDTYNDGVDHDLKVNTLYYLI
jgi:hypothetical protein